MVPDCLQPGWVFCLTRQAEIDRHVLKPDHQELSYHFLMIRREALQQVSKKINAITGFSEGD